MEQDLSIQIKNLPQNPGVYIYYNKKNTIIYIGKAKKLRARVLSYFKSTHTSSKTASLVRNICRLEYFVVDTEEDALLLENSLIKKHQPKYNILLKDDKTYPWICIKNEEFPRVFVTRNIIKDGSLYFGPYSSYKLLDSLIELIKKIYPIRSCKLTLSDENITARKFKTCLQFHIGNCNGICVGKDNKNDYDNYISNIRAILSGRIKEVKLYMLAKMKVEVDALNFEKAQYYKEKLNILSNYQSSSTVVSSTISNVDVFSYIESEEFAFINYLKIVDGAIIETKSVHIKRKLNETKEELLQHSFVEMLSLKKNNEHREIIVPFNPEIKLNGIIFTTPQRGAKLKLLELSTRNAKLLMLEKLKNSSSLNGEQRSTRILETMKSDLHLHDTPFHIECFDNSNIQGTNPVASCVVFKNGKPSKKDYRHYNIKTIVGANDFASMEEIISRRYARLRKESQALPQLIVVDGGKGQLNAAIKSLEKLELIGKVAVIGIAKRLEELFFPNDPIPLYLAKSSETLKIIQFMRDEAHRFAITFHRRKRSNEFLSSELDSINGIGAKTKSLLLERYKSVDQIKIKSKNELASIIGNKRAEILVEYFK